MGVDVFFVISGYLITRNIISDIDSERGFSFKEFYIRRARRLFPALLVVVIATLIAAVFVFESIHLKRAAGAAIYSLGFTSNFYFWQEGGYFALSGQYKPLLHTWSLSVEEQYYLIYPVMLVLAVRFIRKLTFTGILFVAICSLLLSDYLYYDGKPYSAFFLLPTRIFEFAIGALVVFLPHNKKSNEWLNAALTASGLALILFSVFIYSDATPSPTLYALVPCLGAAAVIFAGPNPLRSLLLENRAMQWTGRISYSLYLVHWPLIVFFTYQNIEPTAITENIALIAATFVLAIALHYAVEKPLRAQKSKTTATTEASADAAIDSTAAVDTVVATPKTFRSEKRKSVAISNSFFAGAYLSCVAITFFFAAIFWAKGDLLWRDSNELHDRTEMAKRAEALRRYDNEQDFFHSSFTEPDSGLTPSSVRLLFIGDSHAEDIAHALFANTLNRNFEYDAIRFDSFCQPQQDFRHTLARSIATMLGKQTVCDTQLKDLAESSKIPRATHIFMANKSTEKTSSAFQQHLKLVKSRTDAQIIVFGQNATFTNIDDFKPLADYSSLPLNEYVYNRRSVVDKMISHTIKQAAEKENVHYIDREALVCDDEAKSCTVANDGTILYLDSNHWNTHGRAFFGQRILDHLELNGLLECCHSSESSTL